MNDLNENKLLEVLWRHTNSTVILLSKNFKIIELNNKAKEFYCWQDEEVVQKNFLDLCNAYGYPSPVDKNYFKNPILYEKNLCMVADGKQQSIHWKIIPILIPNINDSQVILIGEKIEKKKASVIDYLMEIIECIPGCLYWKDLEGHYLGCNNTTAELAGLKSVQEIVGKTDQELWGAQANILIENDQKILRNGGIITVEEKLQAADGRWLSFTGVKMPLRDAENNIIGIIGNSLDITAKKEAIQLKQEKERTEKKLREAKLQQQENFVKIAEQVAHDIRSPLSSLLMIVKSCSQIPEEYRIALREAAMSIGDIANHLLSRYKKNDSDEINEELESSRPLLVSAILLEILAEKKYQYQNSSIKFDLDVMDTAHFAFIKIQPSSFRRAISNLINNAVDAFDDKLGKIIVRLTATKESLQISIIDNGKGIPEEIKEKILNQIAVTNGKKEGCGIGLAQVHETLQRYQGNLTIESSQGTGTEMRLTFPRIAAQSWIAEEIRLKPNDIIVILDDDNSIHRAWYTQFGDTLETYPELRIKHFHLAHEALDFIKKLSVQDRSRLFLLTDFELLNQELTGLQVVVESSVQRSILVISHYANKQVLQEAARTNTKILPKQLASEIPIRVESLSVISESEEEIIDAILVDDNKQFINILKTCIFTKLTVDDYQDPHYFLEQVHDYDKTIKIYLDSNFDNSTLKGIEIAEKLHTMGFTRLYLLTGEDINKGKIPDYLTAIRKDDLNSVVSSLK